MSEEKWGEMGGNGGKWGEMGGNGGKWGVNGGERGCGQQKFITVPAPAPPCSIFPSLCPMADQVHLFNGVRHVPIKAIRDPDRKWFSAGWLSKQMSLNNYHKTKQTKSKNTST